ncbi:MFS transporter [Paenibacillus sp. VMFN-D1]|uniref:MFS transporter n=1 Tax=Paenibacillus sp. VMFN-D1 TaxID=2135608 RepID=UPI000E265C82|nr:MFS transporter [Paenibacillus sp. VMFN-D1]RED37394.1 putative MFS family arabinose efflux permease [Paenibacillus sp. VMFN-D1]
MKLSIRITLLCMAVTATFAPMLAAPALKSLKADFPDTSALLIQWVVTLSSLFILPTLLFASTLAKKFSRKSILVVGLAAYVIGGIGPVFVNSIPWILVFRAILGLSIGLISPTFNALIAESFQGNERTKMNGWVTAVNGIGGAIFLSIGGFIATYGWRSVFLSYSYALLLLFLVLFFLPKFPPVQVQHSSKRSAARIPASFYLIALLGGLHVMLYFTIPTSLSLYLTEIGIGTASTVGYYSAISLFSIFLAGVAYPVLTRIFHRFVVTFGLVLYGTAFLLESFAQNIWMIAVAVLFMGFAQGIFFPMSFTKTAQVVPKERLTTAISILLACIYGFQFLCPLFMSAVSTLFGFSSTRNTFLLLAVGLALSVIVSILSAHRVRVKKAQGGEISTN